MQATRAAFRPFAPATWPVAPPDVSNRFADDPAAIALGARWFLDPGFSGALVDGDNDGSKNALGKNGETGKVACAGCHLPEASFLDARTLGQQISLGAGWGTRRAPSLLDVGQARLITWDGRRDALYNQVFAPLESPVEMNSSRLFLAQQIFARYRVDYEAVFGALPPLDDVARFPPLTATTTGCQPVRGDAKPICNGERHGMPGDGAEFDGMAEADRDAVTRVVVNFGKALGAYERTLTCGPGRFDRWVRGEIDFTDDEAKGAALFVGEAGCVRCHSGTFFTDQKFHNIGLKAAVVAVAFLDLDDHGAAEGMPAALADPLNVRGAFSDGDDGRLDDPMGGIADPTRREGAFRTPSLRCVSQRPSLMHTGQIRTLKDAVAFHVRGGDANGYFGENELEPLSLDSAAIDQLTAFLLTLDGNGVSP